jgi:hypothetical protein
MSVNHYSLLKTKYCLEEILAYCTIDLSLDVPTSMRTCLLPLIFWYDSNHICHVQRYLQIFTPYKALPEDLREYFGLPRIKEMLLKNGDFIEDRFGQAQRNVIMASKRDPVFHRRIFQWFGSYLLWHMDDELSQSDLRIANETIRHLKGRQIKPEWSDQNNSFFEDLTHEQLSAVRAEKAQSRAEKVLKKQERQQELALDCKVSISDRIFNCDDDDDDDGDGGGG